MHQFATASKQLFGGALRKVMQEEKGLGINQRNIEVYDKTNNECKDHCYVPALGRSPLDHKKKY